MNNAGIDDLANARAMFALVVCVLALVTYARLSDVPLSATPPEGAIVAEREMILSFNDLSGAVQVLNPDRSLMADLGPEEGGFVAGVARVINRERIKNRATPDGPVVLVRRDTVRTIEAIGAGEVFEIVVQRIRFFG